MPPLRGSGLRTRAMPAIAPRRDRSPRRRHCRPRRCRCAARAVSPSPARGARPFTPSPKRSTAWPSFSVSTTNSRRLGVAREQVAPRVPAPEVAFAAQVDRRAHVGHVAVPARRWRCAVGSTSVVSSLPAIAHAALLRQRRDRGAIERIARHAAAGQRASARRPAAPCRRGRPARRCRRRRPCR